MSSEHSEGVLTEVRVGLFPSPPFSGTDPIKIYTMVLHGIEKVDFPKRIGKRPDDLIRRLCR